MRFDFRMTRARIFEAQTSPPNLVSDFFFPTKFLFSSDVEELSSPHNQITPTFLTECYVVSLFSLIMVFALKSILSIIFTENLHL